MSALYHDAQRRLQNQFDTRRLADRIEERLVHDNLDESDTAFVNAADMFFLATVDPQGRPIRGAQVPGPRSQTPG